MTGHIESTLDSFGGFSLLTDVVFTNYQFSKEILKIDVKDKLAFCDLV